MTINRAIVNRANVNRAKARQWCKTDYPGNLTADEVYKMIMLHKYQRKSCSQLAQQFGITRGQAYNILSSCQVGGCCG
jgi:hypothetical protein